MKDLRWTRQEPTAEGKYLFRKDGEWSLRLFYVDKGNWRLSENPEWLYANGYAVGDIEHRNGIWLGPLLAPPENNLIA